MELAFLVIAILIGGALIIPWVNLSRIRTLRDEIDSLKLQIKQLASSLDKARLTDTHQSDSKAKPAPTTKPSPPLPVAAPPISKPYTPSPRKTSLTPKQVAALSHQKDIVPPKEVISFEQQFGSRLPVWIGGIALALAGFFMVKYSIEIGLLTPLVRVILGIVFGIGLLGTAYWVRGRPGIANGIRIAQSLAGAGIADLYFCIFAATNLYELVPPFVGFLGMASVTAVAVVLSLRHGYPIALLGLVGGFLTPAMIGSENPQAPILFIYLYMVLTGLMLVIRKQGWWWLAIPTVLGAFLWVCLWLFGTDFAPGDTLWLGLFLIAVSATVAMTSSRGSEDEITNQNKWFTVHHYLTLGGSLLLMAVITAQSNFGLMEWALFGILAGGSFVLAWFDEKLYRPVPWFSMATTAVMLMIWRPSDINALSLTLFLFGFLYMAGGYLLQSRSTKPSLWACLATATAIGYYLIGYFRLRDTVASPDIPLFWGFLALVFVGLSAYALHRVMIKVLIEGSAKQHLMAVYAVCCAAFVSIGLTIELDREFLSVAIAAQVMAVALISTKLPINALRPIAGVLASVFGYLLLSQIPILFQLIGFLNSIQAEFSIERAMVVINKPSFHLGLPAAFFLLGAYFLRRQRDGKLVQTLEIAAVVMIGLMAYYLTRRAFHLGDNILITKAGYLERTILTNIFFVYGVICLVIGRRVCRYAISLGGLLFCGIAIFRIITFDFLMYNPLWSKQEVGNLPLFNILALAYGLPIAWTWVMTRELPEVEKEAWTKKGCALMLILSFVFVTLNVRQLYQGTLLNSSELSSAEVYTYSLAWLVLGIALLLIGTLRKDKIIRITSLAVMILTVGKVFLYDASQLEGMFRVFSFFGLGVSLIGLSWFYTRFVFELENPFGPKPKPKE